MCHPSFLLHLPSLPRPLVASPARCAFVSLPCRALQPGPILGEDCAPFSPLQDVSP
ncbi:hypothetical protein D187_007329 [Cystobacter fuscus DSM 2262]|uniref:Uncharacterized protein n=1 Tax=Cystobacter fuscus (strain ATCC 25194 / DSM 2262 / NBRC 100088 / M29) TaxID=1242864 RepID=S9QK74_CYSF2|nr:hypothetical protein D187_007329 [Cystobacter fuscus DSM 2262]